MSVKWPNIGQRFFLKTQNGYIETAIVQKSFVHEVNKVRVGDDCVPVWYGTRERVIWNFDWKEK